MAEKSKVFFTNVQIHLRKDMLSCLEFSEGKLPIRYLGMPLFRESKESPPYHNKADSGKVG